MLPPSKEKEKEKEEKRKARGGKMADGTDGTIIILDWCDAHNSEKETRMHTRAGEKKNFPRLANRPYRRTNYHPESQQSVPFSFARILAFSSTHHENFHLAPLIYRNLNLSLSLSLRVNVSTGLPRGPGPSSSSSRERFPFSLRIVPPDPRIRGSSVVVRV